MNNIFLRYWGSYGGFKALFKSPYLYMALGITLLLYPQWSQEGWWDRVLSIMPNVLGFSLGGYAMWMAIGDESFRRLISGPDENEKASPYMEVNSSFVHFILLQILSIVLALFARAYNFSLPEDSLILTKFRTPFQTLCLIGSFFGYFIFIYALTSALAATFALLRISSWYDTYIKQEREKAKKKNP